MDLTFKIVDIIGAKNKKLIVETKLQSLSTNPMNVLP